MSSLDAKDGFWHCVLDRQTSNLTCMETPFGRCRWLRMPFGTSTSSEIFQARMNAAMSGLAGTACIADDILVFGSGDSEEEAIADYNRNQRALLNRCQQKGIKLNKAKMHLNCKSIIFCGHLRNGISCDPRTVEAIVKMPTPTDKAAVMRLLGMATYLSKFCPQFSDITEPLRTLI